MTTLEEAPAQAAHQSERLWVRPRGPGSRQCLRRVSRPDSLRSEDSEGRMGRRGTFWPGARTSLPGSSVAPEGPQEGPPRPAFRAQNALKKHPCGAESRGGGGAPPTHLILLRNQRPPRTSRRARTRPHVPVHLPDLSPQTPKSSPPKEWTTSRQKWRPPPDMRALSHTPTQPDEAAAMGSIKKGLFWVGANKSPIRDGRSTPSFRVGANKSPIRDARSKAQVYPGGYAHLPDPSRQSVDTRGPQPPPAPTRPIDPHHLPQTPNPQNQPSQRVDNF